MNVSYIHQPEPFIKAFVNFNNIRLYSQLKSALIVLAAGILVWIIVLTGLSSKYLLYVGSFLIIYSILTVISELAYRQKLMKLILLRSDMLKDNIIQYTFEENCLHYKEQLMEARTSWSIFKGFVVYKDCIYLLPKIEVYPKHMIIKSSHEDNDFELLITSLNIYLNRLDIKDIKH